jgi:hypothetical protein
VGEPFRINQHVSPIVITYRKVLRKPEYKLASRFVGVSALFCNVRDKLRDLIDELAYETTREVIDPGQTRAVHWAINVQDPWDAVGRSDVVAVHSPGIIPPGAMHFEVIQQVKQEEELDQGENAA